MHNVIGQDPKTKALVFIQVKDSTTAIIKNYVKNCDPKGGKSCKKIVTDFQSDRVKWSYEVN